MRYFRVRWDEDPGLEQSHWGGSWWIFEVGADGYCTSQIELEDTGPRLRYGEGHIDDEFGMLMDQPLTQNDLRAAAAPPFSDLKEITAGEFESVWATGPWSNG